jgi:SAM-dependent methyltransferase
MNQPALPCRACGAQSRQLLLDLGAQPLANNLLRAEDLGGPEPRFPLQLYVCPACWLLQIGQEVPPVKLFTEYLYFTSFSDTMLQHARAAAERYIREFSLGRDSLVIEIASNDGYLLQNFVARAVPCLGIEPAANIACVAQAKGIETLVEFFGDDLARRLAQAGRSADLVLGNNVFAHVPQVHDFVSGLQRVLKPKGRIILEFPDALNLIEHCEFDTIYHEHVFYFSLSALQPLFQHHNLSIFHAERLPIHGGSLRLFVCHARAFPVQGSVAAVLAEEHKRGLTGLPYYLSFGGRVLELKRMLVGLLHQLKRESKTIAAYGASAKGSTLLNFFGLGHELLDFVVDRSPHKQGLFTPGTHLPIVPIDQLLARRPDYTLLLTWNFVDEILQQQQAYREGGGKFIVPIPEVEIR